jgi:predicted phosphodiesterase
LQPLVSDLKDRQGGLGFDRLDYLVISGDLTNHGTPGEFERAREFISGLMEQFGLSAARLVIAPGNHDLCWEPPVYSWQSKRKINLSRLKPDSYVTQGDGYLVRDDAVYHQRFENFGRFYHQLTQLPFSSKPEAQFRSLLFAEARLQFLELNSAWEIDEYFPVRSSIHPSALATAVLKAEEQLKNARLAGHLEGNAAVLRIVVWHHPITGNEKMVDDAFVERLRQADFRLSLHGHVHEERADLIGYVHPRRLHVVGAGSFGAPVRPESTPRLYNLIEVARDLQLLKIHTRALRTATGAWEGWAVWPGEQPNDRRSYYEVSLPTARHVGK